MKINLKKTTCFLLLTSSSVGFSGSMGSVCTPENSTVPCSASAWDFGGQALYMKPVYGIGYGYSRNSRVSSTELRANEDKLDWDWGFKLEGSYHFNTGNDLTINWYHLNSKSNNTIVGTFDAYQSTENQTQWILEEKVDWDAVNAEFGQHVDFGQSQDVRFHAGLQFARLKTTDSEEYIANFGTINALSGNADGSDSYNGLGPRIGADLTYHVTKGFSLYGNAATALLIGTSKYHYNTTETGVTYIDSGSKTAVVPDLEGKLGVKYNYTLSQGNLGLDVGYMITKYFEPYGYFIQDTKRQNDVAFSGIYFGAKWVGSI